MIRNNNAKVNLALNVVKKLENGYHELDMCNILISLHDTIIMKFDKNKDDILISCNNKNIPTDNKNLVYKVIDKVKRNYHLKFGVKVVIKKNIPVEAGLGGGSGNAAITLKMLNDHFDLKMSASNMITFIKDISTDACFMITDTASRVRGIGEKITPLKKSLKGKLFVVKPFSGVSTKEVYSSLAMKDLVHPNINKVCDAMESEDYDTLIKNVGNSLLNPALKLNKEIDEIITKLKECGFDIVSMSGSGSTCFAYGKNKGAYKKAKMCFDKSKYELCNTYSIKGSAGF